MAIAERTTTSVDEILGHLKVDGFTVIREVVPRDRVAAVHDSVEATSQLDEYKNSGGSHLIEFDQSFAPYLADPRIIGVAEALWGPYSRISFNRYKGNPPNIEERTNGPGRHGNWHSDWPFGQRYAAHVVAPYTADSVLTFTTLWMLSDFTPETGATFVVPGSHRAGNNPTGGHGPEGDDVYPTEFQATGKAGDVIMFDARAWHAAGINVSDEVRSAMRICYVPWWLNVNILDPNSVERVPMDATGRGPFVVEPMAVEAYERLPEDVKPLFHHWVRESRPALPNGGGPEM